MHLQLAHVRNPTTKNQVAAEVARFFVVALFLGWDKSAAIIVGGISSTFKILGIVLSCIPHTSFTPACISAHRRGMMCLILIECEDGWKRCE